MKIIRPEPNKRGRPKRGQGAKQKPKNPATPQKRYIKIKRFVAEYLIDFNDTKAYQRCGYGTKNADVDSNQAAKLLNRPDVVQLIAEAEAERAKRVEITQEMVLKEISLIAFANIRDIASWDGEKMALKAFSELSREQTAIISGIQFEKTLTGHKLKFTSPSASEKKNALVDLGKHLGMFWESARQEDPVEFAKKTQEALRQIRERTAPDN